MNTASVVCLLISAVAVGFLIYTLLNLDALEIGVSHPRVLVEFSLAVGFGLLCVFFWS